MPEIEATPATPTWWKTVRHFLFKREIVLAVVAAAALIIVGVFLGWENDKIVPVNPDPLAHYLQEPHNHLGFLANWDGPIYLRIAHEGYKDVDDTGFFPLYPLLTRIVHTVIRSELDSALLVSWTSLVGAIYFYLKIMKRLFNITDNAEAFRGVVFFVLFPSGVVLLASYTESLFAFLALGALYFALKKRWLPAALFSLFATATHINGMLILALVVLLLFEKREKLHSIAATIGIGCLGLLGYMAFLWRHFHNPLEFVSAQKTNGWLHQGYIHHLLATFNLWDVITVGLVLVSAIYWWPRRKSFAIYSLLCLGIPLLGGQFSGFDRYALMTFPLQFMLYDRFRKNPLAYTTLVTLFGIFWGYFMLQYAGGYTGA